MSDRIWKCNTGKYDQVIALTQQMINEGIANLYERLQLKLEAGLISLETLNYTTRETDSFTEVILGAPKLLIDSIPGNRDKARLQIRLKSGYCTFLYKTVVPERPKGPTKGPPLPPPPAKKFTAVYKIENWTIQYPVDLTFPKVDTTTQRGKNIADRIKQKGGVVADHSIYELLLDLGSMSLFDAQLDSGKWTDEDWIYDPDQTQSRPDGWALGEKRTIASDCLTNLEALLKQARPGLDQGGLLTMGYALSTDTTVKAEQKATFEVTNVKYQVQPWRDPSLNQTTPSAVSGTPSTNHLNYLLYLETIRAKGQPTKVPPQGDDIYLSVYTGNWTDGKVSGTDAPSQFGNFCLSYENFMDKFLLPKLVRLNRDLQLDIKQVSCKAPVAYGTRITNPWSVSFDLDLGAPVSAPDSDFAFIKGSFTVDNSWPDELKAFMEPLTKALPKGSIQAVWQDVEFGKTGKSDGFSYPFPGADIKKPWLGAARGETVTFSRIVMTPGSRIFKLEGRSWTRCIYDVALSILFMEAKMTAGFTCTAKWSITFELTEVSDGGLMINVTSEKPEVSFPWSNESGLTNCVASLKGGYTVAGRNFEYFVKDLRNCLQGQDKFIFPAAGVYYFKNPMFNYRGDLIAGLSYNANIKSNMNPEAKPRLQASDASYENMPVTPKDVITGDKVLHDNSAVQNK